MKARVKATGDIIELCNMEFDEDGNDYYRDELEFIGDFEPDYWDKLKHQYVGMSMHALLSNTMIAPYKLDEIAKISDRFATALIEKLKNEK